jgi:hypothetical protein
MDSERMIFCLAVDSTNQLLAGSDIGVYTSRSKGDYFSYLKPTNLVPILNIRVFSNAYIYTCFPGGIQQSKNSGEVWDSYGLSYFNTTSLTSLKNNIFISSIDVPSNGGLVKVTYLLDKGDIKIAGLPLDNDSIKALDVINKNDTLYLGLSNGLYYSFDEAESWNSVSEFDGYKVDHFVLNSKNDLYFIVNGTDEKAGVYCNFTKIFDELFPISAIAVNRNNDVFVATSNRGRGVFVSTNNGIHWTENYNGLDSCEITALISDMDGFVYVGTDRQGIYKSTLSTTDVNSFEALNLNDLVQSFPNPFSESTTIKFNIESNCEVRLSVYNFLGQEVAVLVNQFLPAGQHTEKFDGTNLPQGTYFYKLQAGGEVKTGKIMLIHN